MKQVIIEPPRPPRLARPGRRLGVAEAKSRLSEVLRRASDCPTIIHSRGRDLAVVLSMEDYALLTGEQGAANRGGARFLDRIQALKERHGGGVDEFAPPRLAFRPEGAFAKKGGAGR